MERILNSAGKECFVNCFQKAMQKNGKLTNDDILEYCPEIKFRTGGHVSSRALSTRRSNILRLFRENLHLEALRICISAQINATIREKAKRLYDKYSTC